MAVSKVHHFLPLDCKSGSKYITYDFAFIIIKFVDRRQRDLSHELSSFARTQGSGVRIALEAWMSVFILFVLGSGLATG
jgi:hypothetical protein